VFEPRAAVSLGYTFSVQKLRAVFGGFSPIAVTALLSIALLLSVSVVRITLALRPAPAEPAVVAAVDATTPSDTTPVPLDSFDQQSMFLLGMSDSTDLDATTTNDHLSLIGPMIAGEMLGTYARILDSGQDYTKEDLRQAAARIAERMKAAVAYDAFENSDFTIDPDSSAERVRVYRDQLQEALKPLSSIPSAEYVIYGHYVETSDPKYLTQLTDAAAAYRASADAGAQIRVPQDAINYHRELLNSLRAFAAVLDGLVSHGDDSYASVALLRTYNEKEQGIYDSFDRMRSLFARKSL
jgi:hypothetical protein